MEYRQNDRVMVENMRDWDISFGSMERPGYGIVLRPHVPTRLSFGEVEAQAQLPGSFFYGNDGLGSYAPVRIVDSNVRAAIFGKSESAKEPEGVTLEFVRNMLKIMPNTKFKAALQKSVVNAGDKRMFARLAVKAGLDDVAGGAGKKKIIEDYTGYHVTDVDACNPELVQITTMPPSGVGV